MLIQGSSRFFPLASMEFVRMKFWKVFDFVLFGTAALIALGLSVLAMYGLIQGFWKGVFGAVFWIVVIVFLILWHYRPSRSLNETESGKGTLNGSGAKSKDP